MLHLLVLWLCHLSYIQLGKLDDRIPHPKPHLTLPCFVKILSHIPFTVGLQLSYFQNVTKFIRDLAIFLYIIGQYYTFHYDLIYRLLGFEVFAVFAMPLILEGWIPNSPNYVLYILRFYTLYIPIFVNQFLLHENRMLQSVFFFALIEIPSMVYQRIDREHPEAQIYSNYIFRIIQLPDSTFAILHCTRRTINDATHIELAIAVKANPSSYTRSSDDHLSTKINSKLEQQEHQQQQQRYYTKKFMEFADQQTWVITKRVAVDPNTSDLNYVEENNLLVVSSSSDVKIYNARNLQLLKFAHSPRTFKRLAFLAKDRYFSSIKKITANESLIQIYDVVFHTTLCSYSIQQDIQPEILKFIKYNVPGTTTTTTNTSNTQNTTTRKYAYICVPSDRLNCIVIVDIFGAMQHNSGTGSITPVVIVSGVQSEASPASIIPSLQQQENSNHRDMRNPSNIGNNNESRAIEEMLLDNYSETFAQNIDELGYVGATKVLVSQVKAAVKKRARTSIPVVFREKSPPTNESWDNLNIFEYLKSGTPFAKADESVSLVATTTTTSIGSAQASTASITGSVSPLVREYIVDVSAIKDILVYERLLVISCSENIVFFDLEARKVIKRISTLSFDSRVHWIRVTQEFTYYLISNEIKAWIVKESNVCHKISITKHYNFFGIQYIQEDSKNNCLYVVYNNTLYKQRIALIQISDFE